MMKDMLRKSGVLLLISLTFAGQGQAAEPTARSWDSAVAQAKKEGSVSIYTNWRPGTRIALTKAFFDRYGINLDFVPFSRGEDITVRASKEKSAGLKIADVFGTGAPSLITVLKPKGLLGPMKPLLILPEVTDPKAWRGQRFPFMDKDQKTVGMMASVNRDIIYNVNQVKKGEISTYKDLLKPQYKGKIVINDPSVTGSGNAVMNHLAMNIWNLQEAKDYLRQLLTQQAAVVERDNRLQVETVARGKYAIGFAPNPDALSSFLKLGAPLGVVMDKEGVSGSSAAGSIAVAENLAHPNATKVFVNWLLTKEGQTVFAQSFGTPSLRIDTPITGIDPVFLVQPGEKLYFSDEAEILSRPKMRAICKEIVDATMK